MAGDIGGGRGGGCGRILTIPATREYVIRQSTFVGRKRKLEVEK